MITDCRQLQKFTKFLTNSIFVLGIKNPAVELKEPGQSADPEEVAVKSEKKKRSPCNILYCPDLEQPPKDSTPFPGTSHSTSSSPGSENFTTRPATPMDPTNKSPSTAADQVVPLPEEAMKVSVTEIRVTVNTTTVSSTTETSILVTSTNGNITVTRLNVTTTLPPGLPSGQVPPSPEPNKLDDSEDSLGMKDRKVWFDALPLHWQVVVVCVSIWSIVFILLIAIKLGGRSTIVHMVTLTRDYIAGTLNANSVAQFLESLADRIRSSPEVVECPTPPPNTSEPDNSQAIYWVNIFKTLIC